MPFDPGKHHRRSIRLQDFDYSQPGAYYVTICTMNRECLFGEIAAGDMHFSDAGRMVQSVLETMPDYYADLALDAFVVMPNHVHCIIELTCIRTLSASPLHVPHCGTPKADGSRGTAPLSLPDAVHRFKSLTTTRYRRGVGDRTWPRFAGRLWQRNYYERVVRNERELQEFREYIVWNPLLWEIDHENPERR